MRILLYIYIYYIFIIITCYKLLKQLFDFDHNKARRHNPRNKSLLRMSNCEVIGLWLKCHVISTTFRKSGMTSSTQRHWWDSNPRSLVSKNVTPPQAILMGQHAYNLFFCLHILRHKVSSLNPTKINIKECSSLCPHQI